VELYRGGRIVVVYPEGGRSPAAVMKPFTPDFARLIIKLKAPIIPTGIAGARDMLPIGARIPRRNASVAVAIGAEFSLSEYYGQPLTSEVLKAATAKLQGRVGEMVDEANTIRSTSEI
jgi:1-acyl-sn-glycerol-3-phosphate acyltransferase